LEDFVLYPAGPFSLLEARRFLASFAPAGQVVGDEPGRLLLAFAVDGADEVAAVTVGQDTAGVTGRVVAASGAIDHDAVRGQVARILSLDADAQPFVELLAADAALASRATARPGLRPVLFSSPYEAAAWSVLSARLAAPAAAALRRRVVEAAGAGLRHDGTDLLPFPAPRQLLDADLDAVPRVRAERLRGIARAALEGALEPAALRDAAPEDATAGLQQLPGIGPFYATLILIRGAGARDVLPAGEPRIRRATAVAYGRPELASDVQAFLALAERWRPWRSWVAFVLRATA
jgi:DNA-3-methyladenine glycosylase II